MYDAKAWGNPYFGGGIALVLVRGVPLVDRVRTAYGGDEALSDRSDRGDIHLVALCTTISAPCSTRTD